MKVLTFLCILFLSVAVYAKTEAVLKVPGFEKKPQRNIATSTVSDLGVVMNQLNKIGSAPSAKSYTDKTVGFSGDFGALKRNPKTKSAVPPLATADSSSNPK